MNGHKVLTVLSNIALLCGSHSGMAEETPPCTTIHNAFPFLNIVKSFTHQGNSPSQQAISDLIDQLALSSVVIREGMDREQWPLFINAQADFEQAIVYGIKTQQITNAICMIHMPAPDTSLCTNGEISEGLVDPGQPLMVKERSDILRDYLQEGGSLIAVYPKDGRNLRSAEQLAILDALANKYVDDLQLIELNCQEIPKELIGTTYFLTFADTQTAVLSLQSDQTNDDQWAIWFGPIDDPVIMKRLEEVFSFLDLHGF